MKNYLAKIQEKLKIKKVKLKTKSCFYPEGICLLKETVVELSSGFGSLLRQRDRLQKSIPTQMQSLKGAIASEEGVRQKERSPYVNLQLPQMILSQCPQPTGESKLKPSFEALNYSCNYFVFTLSVSHKGQEEEARGIFVFYKCMLCIERQLGC